MSSITPIRNEAGRAIKYRARYRSPDGSSRSKTCDTMAEARLFLATVEHKKATGEYVDQAASRTLFGAVARQWQAGQPHRESTAEQVESILTTHILPTFEHRPIGSIRTSEVQAWVSGLPLAPSTVTVVYGKLAAIFNAAVDDRLIATSPCRPRAIKMPRATGSEVTPMEPSEVRAMIATVNPRYSALLLLIAGTGVRPAEALGLTADRVLFLKRQVRIDRQLVTVANRAPFLAPPKTPQSVRTIPAPQAVFDALAHHMATYPLGPDGLIFTDSKGDPIRRNAIGHIWRRAAKVAGVVDRSPHDLRHYAASVMIDQGQSVKAVQKQLGHKNASTTLDTYAHLWHDAEDVTRAALDAGVAQLVSPACHDSAAKG